VLRLAYETTNSVLERWQATLRRLQAYEEDRRITQDRQCTYNVRVRARSLKHCGRRKAATITFIEHVSVALVIQHAMRMRPNMSSVVCSAPQRFQPYLINGTIFGRDLFGRKCVFCVFIHFCLKHFLF
jgi:hypothetical protein